MIASVISHAKKNYHQYFQDVCRLLRIPSISSLAEHQKDCLKAANWLAKYIKQLGLEHVQLVKTSGNPIVYADWLHAQEKPTLLIYGHYDVQPADPLDQWQSPPFKPTLRRNYLYGRGTADDKCHLVIYLAAISAYLKTGKLPLNIKLAFEGEEEIGSRNFAAALKSNKQLFSHDIALIADFGMPTKNTPAIMYGLRGIVYTAITVKGPKQDLHSGVYGGVVANPAQVLSQLLATLKDKSHRITIAGFYDDVKPISKAERKILASYPRKAADLKRETGVKQLIHEPGVEVFEQNKTRPSLDINGLYSGFSGKAIKTIIPSTACAKVSLRLVPNQKPTKVFHLFKRHLLQQAPATVSVKVDLLDSATPVLTNPNQPLIHSIKKALETTFNRPAVYNRSGGSIPATSDIIKFYNQPTVAVGFVPPGNNMHGPNENFYLPNFKKGIRAAIRILDNLGKSA